MYAGCLCPPNRCSAPPGKEQITDLLAAQDGRRGTAGLLTPSDLPVKSVGVGFAVERLCPLPAPTPVVSPANLPPSLTVDDHPVHAHG